MASITRYSDGTTTINIGGAVEDYLRQVLDATTTAAVEVLEREAQKVADEAEEAWYSQVKRRTGKTGVIDVVTTITPSEIRVAIGSRDLQNAKYVHRPGVLSQLKRAATQADFKSGAAKASPPGERLPGRGVVEYDNPAAADGKYLLQELVGKPARAIIRKVNAVLPVEIEAQMRRGRSG